MKFMKKVTLQLFIALFLVGMGFSACSSSSKHVPDFRGVYKCDLELPNFGVDNKARLTLRPSATSNDPYQLDAYLIVFLKDGKKLELEKLPIIVKANEGTDNTFSFTGHKEKFDFHVFGIGTLKVKGEVVEKELNATLTYKLEHKSQPETGSLTGYKTSTKESSVAKLDKVICDDGQVLNILIDHDKSQVEVFINRKITENQLQELRLTIIPAESGSFQVNTEILKWPSDMIITVISEDGSKEKVYDVKVTYVDL